MKIYFISLIFILSCLGVNAQIRMQKQDDGIVIREKNDDVLYFHTDPNNKDGMGGRNNYIHPLWGLDNKILTEDAPDDHLHHRGIFWAWHQIWIDGLRIGDGWMLEDFEQDITNIEFISTKEGVGILNTSVDWKSEKWMEGSLKVPFLQEKSQIKVYPKAKKYRRIDFEIELLALAEKMSIGGSEDAKGYGGFSVRLALPEDVAFSGPHGEIIPQNLAVESNGYVNISGAFGAKGKDGGVVIIDHSENPMYPQNWILRSKNSMQNIVYPGEKAVGLSTKEPTILKYTLLIYNGKLTDSNIQKIISGF